MTDPKRLIDGRDPGGALLASALSDAPRPGARNRVAEALGLAVAGGAPNPGSAGNGLAAPHQGSAATLASGSKLLWGLLVVATVTVGALVGWTVGKSQRRSPSADATTLEASERPTEESPTRLEPLPETSPETSPETLPSSQVAPPPSSAEAARGHAARIGAAQSAEGSLTHELHMLDVARKALDRVDAREALSQLDRYDHAFPVGALRAEASVLRVRALLGLGDGERARALARDLLARDPSGPHARRLRELLEAR